MDVQSLDISWATRIHPTHAKQGRPIDTPFAGCQRPSANLAPIGGVPCEYLVHPALFARPGNRRSPLLRPGRADTPSRRVTLKGIKAVAVVVEDTPADAQRDGLTRNLLQTDVEQRLRQAGITVDDDAPGMLAVFVNTLKIESGFYAYAIRVQFRQPSWGRSGGQFELGLVQNGLKSRRFLGGPR